MPNFYTNVARLGNKILYRGYGPAGRIEKRDDFSPTLFIPTDREDTGWKGIHGENLMPKTFDKMSEARAFYDQYRDVDNLEIHGNTNYVAQYIQHRFPGAIDFLANLVEIGNIDIEVKSDEGFPEPKDAKYPITSICYKSTKNSHYNVWGLKDYDPAKSELDGVPIRYVKCASEQELIMMFLCFWEANCPDIITGWNIKFFDIPYIVNRILRILGENSMKRLSPWNRVNYREIKMMNKKQDTYDLVGVSTLDYMDVFKKFDFTYGTLESYKLDHVAHVVLGEKKLSYEEHGSLHKLYEEDHQKFIDYNVKDVLLIDRMEERLKLLERVMTIAYMAGVNYVDTLGTTGIWDTIIYRFLFEMGIAVPKERGNIKSSYPGGYVKDPMIGMHNWVTSFDLNSLYPNLIVQYNMSPETLVDGLEPMNGVQHFMTHKPESAEYSVAVNGSRYRKDKQGVLPQIIVEYYNMRKKIKKDMLTTKQAYEDNPSDDLKKKIVQLDNAQMAVKILLNSLYGAMGNVYFRYYDLRIAEGITLSGQMAILWAERGVNKLMNKVLKTDKDYVIAIDTDSLYVNMDDLVKAVNPDNPVDFLDKAAEEKFVPMLAAEYQNMFEHMNAYSPRMVMAREVIADRGVWTAKKRYILNVHDNEGVRYAEPKIKVMGLEAVKSSTPQVVRDKFQDAFKIILRGTEAELQQFVENFRTEFNSLPPEDVSFPRGISEIDKWTHPLLLYKKGTPIHVRGGIVFNHQLVELGLDKTYEMVQNGSKVKFSYLTLPNPVRENVIAFTDYLPQEMDLHQYIDYKTQFDKTFKDPLEIITKSIGWNVEKIATLEAFFG